VLVSIVTHRFIHKSLCYITNAPRIVLEQRKRRIVWVYRRVSVQWRLDQIVIMLSLNLFTTKLRDIWCSLCQKQTAQSSIFTGCDICSWLHLSMIPARCIVFDLMSLLWSGLRSNQLRPLDTLRDLQAFILGAGRNCSQQRFPGFHTCYTPLIQKM